MCEHTWLKFIRDWA